MCKFKSKTSALDEVRTKRNQKMPLIQFRMKLKLNVQTAFDDIAPDPRWSAPASGAGDQKPPDRATWPWSHRPWSARTTPRKA